MSDNIKLVIEIPKELYENKKGYLTNMDAHIICKAVQNGTPLDTVKAEILDYNIRQRVSGSEKFLLGFCAGMDKSAEILDNIGKAESEDNGCI